MRHGALLSASPIPARIPVIDFARAGLTGPSSPNVTDWTTVPPDGDPLGNDHAGNCVYAARQRWAQIKFAARYNRVEPCDADAALSDYARGTGYNPSTGANDNGTDPNAMMEAWGRNPNDLIFGSENWPIIWARVKPTSLVEVGEAMRETPLLLTAWLPRADMNDPENWGNAPGTGAAWQGSEGHEMLLVRNGDGFWTVRSWGLDLPWHLDRVKYIHDLAAPLESSRTDFARLGLDFDEIRA